MRKRRAIAICMLSLVLAGVAYVVYTEEAHAALGWQTAIEVKLLFYNPLPHFGTTYAVSCGSQQYYNGPRGQPSGYSSWDWCPSSTRWALLLEKTWLLLDWSERATPSYHHAFMTCYGR